ncbi:MAG: hypothetical protein QXJ31_05345 [Candidatus Bathyarchaeia archaeon]
MAEKEEGYVMELAKVKSSNELNKLEEDILQYLANSPNIMGYRDDKGKYHEEKTYDIDYMVLWDELHRNRKVPRKKLWEALYFLELKGYIWWDNGSWVLTKKR